LVSVWCQGSNLNLDYPRQLGLDRHNFFRSLHRAQSLRIDSNINNVAQNYANRLAALGRLVHSGNPLYGENLYVYCVSPKQPDVRSRCCEIVKYLKILAF
jgi:hypothetical protein